MTSFERAAVLWGLSIFALIFVLMLLRDQIGALHGG